MAFKAPFLPPAILRQRAEAFLEEHHPSRAIPVPIEHIVEMRFGIDIIPVPGLQQYDTVALISQDLGEIRVDEFVYRHRPNRYRFSLAHELAHRVLHAELFREFAFRTVAQWRHLVTEVIPDEQYRFLEVHANTFAGLILVPTPELQEAYCDFVEKARASGIDPGQLSIEGKKVLRGHLARVFEVSEEAVGRRLIAESL